MKRNLYNFSIKDDADDTITSEGYEFYNLQMEKEYFNLICLGGDTLTSIDDVYLIAHNVS